jgi:hypothetical protein
MLQASMYFAYAGNQRPGIRARTTFEAILLGERTSTTRFPCWPGYAKWLAAKPGDRVRFFEDREMRGRFVDVIVESMRPVDLARCSDAELEEWSVAEGWSTAYGRQSGRRHGAGLQIRYRNAETSST